MILKLDYFIEAFSVLDTSSKDLIELRLDNTVPKKPNSFLMRLVYRLSINYLIFFNILKGWAISINLIIGPLIAIKV